MQIEPAYLRRADVNVVRTSEIGGVRRAQETKSVGQHFQGSFAEYAFAFFGLISQQRENQVLLAHSVGVLDFVGDRHLHQFGDVEVFQVGQMHKGRDALSG